MAIPLLRPSPSRRHSGSLLASGARGRLGRAGRCATAAAVVLALGSCTPAAGWTGKGARTVLSAVRPVRARTSALIRQDPRSSVARSLKTSPVVVTAVLEAWRAEMEAFYRASALGAVSSRRLERGVVPGSPQDEAMTAYLSAQVASGVVGPSRWHIAAARLVSLTGSGAVVSGCSYDPGSHLRSDGLAAPGDLGGRPALTAYLSDMAEVRGSWMLERTMTADLAGAGPPGACSQLVSRLLAAHASAATSIAGRSGEGAGNGGGAGSTGTSIWTLVWWLGTPLGPGPYTGGAAGGAALCVWQDVGTEMSDLNAALAGAGLPASFWTPPRGGGYPGVWSVDVWAAALLERALPSDHFDVVACPSPGQVPGQGGYVEADLPPAVAANGKVMYLWIYWDTVADPPASDLPPLIYEALARAVLPSPVISTSPASIDGLADATIVNFPTWLWIDSSAWRTVTATAAGGGLVATVWAEPVSVTWRAGWSFPQPGDDPEGGITFVPEDLDLSCDGPGAPYDESLAPALQESGCQSVFTQSSFGTYQPLQASISWQVDWALSDGAGVVGGEGELGGSASSATRPLRVLQVESVITQG